MPRVSVLTTVLREMMTRYQVERIPEPDLIMNDPDKVSAYTSAGLEDGVMGGVYLYNCMQICDIIHPGDTVLDLACGPGTQLCMVARINPDINFIGIDMSPSMLERAESQVAQQGLSNVSFRQGDISKLDFFKDCSIDAVISTMALHHLPTVEHLHMSFKEIARILKPNSGIYLADFGRLKSKKSMQSFAYQHADTQPELFIQDYLFSLRAAFTLNEFRDATQQLHEKARLYSTFAMPFMVAIKSASRSKDRLTLKKELKNIKRSMNVSNKSDFYDLSLFFRLGGLSSPFLS